MEVRHSLVYCLFLLSRSTQSHAVTSALKVFRLAACAARQVWSVPGLEFIMSEVRCFYQTVLSIEALSHVFPNNDLHLIFRRSSWYVFVLI